MQANVALSSTTTFELHDAFLLYRRNSPAFSPSPSPEVFVTHHLVSLNDQGAPVLGVGSTISKDAVLDMVKELRGSIPVEFLPENVLTRTADSIVWWTPASIRPMFYMEGKSTELSQLSGKRFPQPPLVLRLESGSLQVRALRKNERPKPTTELYRAPYWNVNDHGDVCLGSTRVPSETSVATLREWEKAFFTSEFTHANTAQKLTTHPGGFTGLWKSLIGTSEFPSRLLADAKETLQQFIQ